MKYASPRVWLSFLAIWAVYALLMQHLWFLVDDAFISFRYARNLAEGHGLRFNPGAETPVEGYSNLLWVLWLALIERLGGASPRFAPLTSFLAGSILLGALYRLLRWISPGQPWTPWLATLSLAASPPFAAWSSGGLETIAFSLLLFIAFSSIVVRAGSNDAIGIAAGVALVLVRVDGFLWALLVALGAWWRSVFVTRESFPAVAIRYLLAVLAAAVAMTGWRLFYYGEFTANTVRVKIDPGADLLWRGCLYVAGYFVTFIAPFAWVPAVLASYRNSSRGIGIPASLFVVAFAAMAAIVGGDWMPMGRLLVPLLPFAALLTGLVAADVWERAASAGRAAVVFGFSTLIVLGALPAFGIQLVPASRALNLVPRGSAHAAPFRTTEYEKLVMLRQAIGPASELGSALKECSASRDSIVLGGIGIVGYYSGLHVYDRPGLTDREIARLPVERLRAPGHDKMVDIDHFLGRRPTILSAELVPRRRLREASAALDRRLESIRGAREAYDLDLCLPRTSEPGQALVSIRALGDGDTSSKARELFSKKMERALAADSE